ncbi:hypothetical protein BSKO_03678 [Bryopsis sp. KO-2023]|nr:hypothetical protein BSKO_03678 [Bryopsis sp. KO-2023]
MTALLIGFILFSSLSFAAEGESCPNAVDHSCEGFSALGILVTGGECSGTAAASCKVVTRSQDEFQRAFADWWSSAGRFEKRNVQAAAREIATAVSKVWGDVVDEVPCRNKGFACGWVIANAISYSLAIAESIAHAAADAIGDEAARICFADIRSLALGLAEVATQSQKATCGQAGLPFFMSNYAENAAPGIARGLLRAFSGTRNESRCSSGFPSSKQENKAKLGDFCGGTGESMPCVGAMKELCCSRDVDQKICDCMENRCSNGPWMRRSNFDDATGKMRSFYSQRGEVCFCVEETRGQ